MDSLTPRDHVFYIETTKIRPNPMQPRRDFDEVALGHLAASIREYGILQPLVVSRVEREVPGGTVVDYELIAGERRWRAAQIANLREVPAIVRREESSKIKLELAIVENIQREDLNPLERALAYKRLADEFGLTQKAIADRVGKSRESIANIMRLLNLPDLYKQAIAKGTITEGHARPLLMLTDYPAEQQQLYDDIVVKGLNVREAEAVARDIARERSRKYRKAPDPEAQETEEQLGNYFGTRVSILKERGGKGRIAIEFFSDEEYRAILTKLTTTKTEFAALIDPTPPETPRTAPEALQEPGAIDEFGNFTV